MLRDRIVCGIADSRLQQHLLAEPKLTLKKAIELARAQETADQGAQQLQRKQPQQSKQLNNLTKPSAPQHGQTTCHRCRGTNHIATECRFKDAVCRKCQKKDTLLELAVVQPGHPNSKLMQGKRLSCRVNNQT